MVIEGDVSRSLAVTTHKFFVARWTLVLGVACQHALDAHTDTLDTLNRTPALRAEKVQAYDAVGINVGMHRYWSIIQLDESDLGCLYFTTNVLVQCCMPVGRLAKMEIPMG